MRNAEILPKEFKLSCERKILSRRELEVLLLVAGGLDNNQIAKVFCVKLTTIKKQLERIYQKLQARNRAHAVFIACFGEIIIPRDFSAVINTVPVQEILSKKR